MRWLRRRIVYLLTRDVRKSRRVLFMTSVVLFSFSGLAIASRRWILDVFGPEIVGPTPWTAEQAERSDAQYGIDEEFERTYAPIWRSRWGERKVSPPPPLPEPVPTPALPPPYESLAAVLARRWTLVACAPHSDSMRSAAILFDRQTGKQIVAFADAELEPGGARVKSIARTRVCLTLGNDRADLDIPGQSWENLASLGRAEIVKAPPGGFRREEVSEFFRSANWVEVPPFGVRLDDRRGSDPPGKPSEFGRWLRLASSSTLLFIDDASIQSIGVVFSKLNQLRGPTCTLVVRDSEGKREITIAIREG